jgi:hypothetical protein
MLAAGRRKPNAAEPRIERAETRSLRSPTAPGDLDANADVNRHLTNCRPDTTDDPQSTGSCDVATTNLPTKRERYWECAELRHTPDTRAVGLPRRPCVATSIERRARQAEPDAFRKPPQTNDLLMLPNRLTVDSDAATGHDDVATAMGFPLGSDDRDVMRSRRSSPRFRADAFPRDASSRVPSDTVAGAGKRLDCPRRAMRTRDKLEVTRLKSSSRGPPPAPSSRSGAYTPPRIDLADGIGSGRERPSPRFGSHRVSWNTLPLAARLRGWRRTDTSADTNGKGQWFGLRGARAVPRRRRATQLAPQCAWPTVRVAGVATDGDPTSSLGGDHDRRSMQLEPCAAPTGAPR